MSGAAQKLWEPSLSRSGVRAGLRGTHGASALGAHLALGALSRPACRPWPWPCSLSLPRLAAAWALAAQGALPSRPEGQGRAPLAGPEVLGRNRAELSRLLLWLCRCACRCLRRLRPRWDLNGCRQSAFASAAPRCCAPRWGSGPRRTEGNAALLVWHRSPSQVARYNPHRAAFFYMIHSGRTKGHNAIGRGRRGT